MNEVLVAPEVYDRLRQVMVSDPEGFRELYRNYLSDAWNALAELRITCEGHRADEFRSKAHYLKGSSLVLGLRQIAQCCAEIEELGRASHFRAASDKLTEINELLLSVQAELEQRLGPRVLPAA